MRRIVFSSIALMVAFCAVLASAKPVYAAVQDRPPGASLPLNAIYPSGCHTEAYGPGKPATNPGNEWKPNCWVGNGYITDAFYVAGVQVIDGDYGCNNGGRDGQYGPNTEAGVKCFQEFYAQTADGIVGPTTWYFEGQTLFYTGKGANYWVYSVNNDPNRFIKNDFTGADGHFGQYSIKCHEGGYLFSDIQYPNPNVPCT